MSRYGTLYLLSPGGPDDPELAHERVVETYENARHYIDVTKELWSLAGSKAQADAIEAIVDRAFEHSNPGLSSVGILLASDIREMLALVNVSELQEALKRTIVDEKLYIRPEQMADVRQRARFIDVDEKRGSVAAAAIWEGLTDASALRNILEEARDRGLDVAID